METNKKEINEFINGLDYKPEDILAYQGETINGVIGNSGELCGEEFIVVERTKHTMNGNYDISVSNSNKSITYPCALLSANEKLVNNTPNPIGLKRGSVKITIDLPGLESSNNKIIDTPDNAKVSAAVDEMLSEWFTKDVAIPAVISYKQDMVYNADFLSLKFGCNVSSLQKKLGINFDMIKSEEISTYLIQFKQIFYTVSCDAFNSPADAFDENVTVKDLTGAGIDSKNPPAYVQNVQYGREIYLMLESKMSNEAFKTFLEGNLEISNNKIDVNGQVEKSNEAKNISYTLITVGGTSKVFSGAFTDSDMIANINSLIADNLTLSRNNPAVPLNYTPAFLKHNEIIQVIGNSEYITTKSTKYHSGKIKLSHTGGFVARFFINWNEISYDQQGNKIVTPKQWSKNGNKLTAKFETEIPLTANSANISITCEGATGLAWEPWRTNLDDKNRSISNEIIVKISGTTLNQKSSIDSV